MSFRSFVVHIWLDRDAESLKDTLGATKKVWANIWNRCFLCSKVPSISEFYSFLRQCKNFLGVLALRWGPWEWFCSIKSINMSAEHRKKCGPRLGNTTSGLQKFKLLKLDGKSMFFQVWRYVPVEIRILAFGGFDLPKHSSPWRMIGVCSPYKSQERWIFNLRPTEFKIACLVGQPCETIGFDANHAPAGWF